MSKCYMCDEEITEQNETKEHIILNALGGRLKSKKLICHDCNLACGSTIDDELASQLEVFSNLLNIKRDRGQPSSFVTENSKTGEKIIIHPGGKPEMFKPQITEVSIGDRSEIYVRARNKQEARKIVTGLKRRYPQIQIEDVLKDSKTVRNYLDGFCNIELKIGGINSFRSICKSAIHFLYV